MREKDIRERIHIFLRNTVRHVVVPASMGIGLALVGGCPTSPPEPNPDGSADTSSLPPGSGGAGGTTSSAAGGAVALYMAMMPDASAGGATGMGGATGAGGATATGGMTSPVLKYMAIMPDADVATGTGGTTGAGGVTGTGGTTVPGTVGGGGITVYMGMAGMSSWGGTTGAGGMTGIYPLYMAISPDAGSPGPDAAPTVKYMAVMPDAGQKDLGGAVALYSAPIKSDAGPVLRYMAVMPPEAGVAQPDYMAPMPVDAGRGILPVYMAPMPTKN